MSSGAKFLSRAHIASYIIQDVQTVIILIPVFSRISTSRSSCPWWMYMYNWYYTCYPRIHWILLVKLGYCWLKGTISSCIFMKWFTYMFYILHHFTCSTPPKKHAPQSTGTSQLNVLLVMEAVTWQKNDPKKPLKGRNIWTKAWDLSDLSCKNGTW